MRRIARYRTQIKNHSKIDLHLLFTTILLSLIGLLVVYDASVVQAFKDYGDKYVYIKQQLIWVFLGFTLLTFFSYFPFNNLKRFALPLFVATFILLIAVFIPGLGTAAGGAHRWLKIGPFSIQPSELIKLSSIILFARLLERKLKLLPFIGIVAAVSLIVGVFQRDLGTMSVFFFVSVIMYVISGAPLKYFFALIPFSVMAFMIFISTSGYRKQRVLAFLDPFVDPQGYSYHISQILIALGSGGLFGLGLGQSRQKYEYIPEVSTDSIFAIVGEEFGFIGALILICLLGYLVLRGFKIAEECSDSFGKILCFGLTSWIGVQAIINLGSMVSLIPLTGVPLPFISYGGSALMANLVAVGIMLNISKSDKIS